jgi:hypothetical protein
MSMVRNHAIVNQRVNSNHTDLAMTKESPKGGDRGRRDDETEQYKDKIEFLHCWYLSVEDGGVLEVEVMEAGTMMEDL